MSDSLDSADMALEPGGLARSLRFGDVYQPDTDGGQAREVFVKGAGLPELWLSRSGPTVVLELGFGTGTNFLETWRAWRATGGAGALEYIGVDNHPLRPEEAAAVHGVRGALAEDTAELLQRWPEAGQAAVRVDLGTPPLHLHLRHTTFERALAGLPPSSVDAVYLDGFAPSKNPGAWTEATLAALAQVMRPGGVAATWCVAGAVRRGLAAAGFDVQRLPGYGRKRERLVAVRRS